MDNLIKKVVDIVLICLALMSFYVKDIKAGNCSGLQCHGHNPHSMGCDYAATTDLNKTVNEVSVERRYSLGCNAVWTRSVNAKNSPQYIAATSKFFSSGFQAYFSQRSSGPVGKNYSVYTNMIGNNSPVASCGTGNPYSLINVPITDPNYCTVQSSY